MKRWCKFSLVSLAVPTIGSVSLVSVGCGDENVIKNVLVAKTNIWGAATDYKEWWNNLGNPNNPSQISDKQLAGLNYFFETKFTQGEVKNVEISAPNVTSQPMDFQFNIFLNDQYFFSGDTHTYISPVISFHHIEPANIFKIPNFDTSSLNIIGSQLDPKAWFSDLGISTNSLNPIQTSEAQKELQVKFLNNLWGTQLTSANVAKMLATLLSTDNSFFLVVTLADNFAFDDGNELGILSNECIMSGSYQSITADNIIDPMQVKINPSISGSGGLTEWINTENNNKTTAEQIADLFTGNILNATNTQSITLNHVEGSTTEFTVVVTLAKAYAFKNTDTNLLTNTWTFTANYAQK